MSSGILAVIFVGLVAAAELPRSEEHINTLGMKLRRIEPGAFQMGEINTIPDELIEPLTYPARQELRQRYPQADAAKFRIRFEDWRRGDFDEKPVHQVTLRRPFYLGLTEVTNAQYEQFDPQHRQLRGKMGFSKEDDEAVIFVSWDEAKAFCAWLSGKEGLPYRLPTEAEWEYAARAGTTTLFSTGNSLPDAVLKNARSTDFRSRQDIVSLSVGRTPPNPWGLFDMHGNVEEWTSDWYGPYSIDQTDPVGPPSGDFKVTRGGSHGTDPYYLRSANRMGSLPGTRSWLIGFRVAIGDSVLRLDVSESPQRKPALPAEVRQIPAANLETPYFAGPRRYVRISRSAHGPLFARHNHDAGITECPNGDLLAIWYTCQQERGRELGVAMSRLRRGAKEWEPAQPFWDAPDRNDHCPSIWYDGKDTLYHFNGLGVAGKWEPLAIIMRQSTDNGYTWSKARMIVPEFGFRNMVGEPVFETKDGAIVFGADAGSGSTIWVSRDRGATWSDPGGNIAGIHAGIVELRDGRLMALGRGQDVDGWMPMSISSDMGKSWQVSASGLPPISGSQRLALIRLSEGPLFLASFAEDAANFRPIPRGKSRRHLSKLFGALSFDEGKTWPVRRVIGVDGAVETIDSGLAHGAEPLGYLSVTQSRDGLIHLISSVNHYAFNTAWLKEPSNLPAITEVRLPLRRRLMGLGEVETLNPRRGFTVEARGKDLELDLHAVPGTALTANHYRLVVSNNSAQYFHDGTLRRLSRARNEHTWRMSVRRDSIVQIYLDGKLLSVQMADLIVDWRVPGRGSTIECKGAAMTYDLSGAYQ